MSASLNSAQCLAQSKNTITYWKQERAFKNKMTVNYIKTVKEECDPNSCYACGTISTWWVLIHASSGLSTSSAIPSTATVWQSTPKLSCLKQPFYYVYRFYESGIWVGDCGMACLCSVTSRASVGKIWWLVVTWQQGAGIPWGHHSDDWWLMLRPQLRLPTKPWASSQNGGFKLLGLLTCQFRFTRQKHHHFVTPAPKSNCIISSTFYWLPVQI